MYDTFQKMVKQHGYDVHPHIDSVIFMLDIVAKAMTNGLGEDARKAIDIAVTHVIEGGLPSDRNRVLGQCNAVITRFNQILRQHNYNITIRDDNGDYSREFGVSEL